MAQTCVETDLEDIIAAIKAADPNQSFEFAPDSGKRLIGFITEETSSTFETNIKGFASAPEIKIVEEPQPEFKYRYKSQTKPYLRGINSSNNSITYPKITLRLQSNNSISNEFYMRCTLHQIPVIGVADTCISPHLLWCCSNSSKSDIHTSEATFFPLIKEAADLYSFTLKEFVIIGTARLDWPNVLKFKLRLLKKQDLGISNQTDLSEEQEMDIEQIAKTHLCNPQNKVRLCFEVFQQIYNSQYTRIAGPFYSNDISNVDAPYINRICNTEGYINEMCEVTLLVLRANKNDRILISEMKTITFTDELDNENIDTLWKESIIIKEQMMNAEQNTVTFNMPVYRGSKNNLNRIICTIQLEKWSDGGLSNVVHFEYINKLKRRMQNI